MHALISFLHQGKGAIYYYGPSVRQLGKVDVLFIDAGANLDGYFSDFERNYAFGEVGIKAHRAYEVVY